MKRIVNILTGVALALTLIVISQIAAPASSDAQVASFSGKRLYGHAWSSNIGWISFSESRDATKSVTIDSEGYLNGFAWSPNIGWIRFGCSNYGARTNTNPTCVKNASAVSNATAMRIVPATATYLAKITGYARACSGMANENCQVTVAADSKPGAGGDWDGLMLFNGTNYGVSIAADGKTLLGIQKTANVAPTTDPYAWGGDVIGWINLKGVSIRSDGDLCTLPDGTALVEGGTAPVITKNGSSCTSTTWACTGGTATSTGATVDVDCETTVKLDEFSCTHAGKPYKGDSVTVLFSKSQVRAGQSCADYSATLQCTRVPVDGPDNDLGEMRIIAPDSHLGENAADYIYPGCRPLPSYIEQ